MEIVYLEEKFDLNIENDFDYNPAVNMGLNIPKSVTPPFPGCEGGHVLIHGHLVPIK